MTPPSFYQLIIESEHQIIHDKQENCPGQTWIYNPDHPDNAGSELSCYYPINLFIILNT